jgi:hypothetical protein
MASWNCKFQLSDVDKIHLCNNRCVRLARFENDRTISFIPPDGAFDLMTYRLSTQVIQNGVLQFMAMQVASSNLNVRCQLKSFANIMQVKPLIWVEAQVERHSRSRVEYTVKARSQFKERRWGSEVSTLSNIYWSLDFLPSKDGHVNFVYITLVIHIGSSTCMITQVVTCTL